MASLFAMPGAANRFADVILPLALPQMLTYGIPTELQGLVQPGMRVEVSLGKNKQYAGIVARLHHEAPEAYEVKPIRALMDELPVVSDIQLRFWEWIADYYAATPGEVMQAALPAHLKLSAETRLQWAPRHPVLPSDWSALAAPAAGALQHKGVLTISELRQLVGRKALIAVLHELLHAEAVIINDALEPSYRPKIEKMISLAPEYATEDALAPVFDILGRAPKQLEALMAFVTLSAKEGNAVRQAALLAEGRVTAAALKALAGRGILQIEEHETERIPLRNTARAGDIVFTPAQQAAFTTLNEGLATKTVALLQGVTGSGKTLLYIQQIRDCIARGEQALLLLPEIGLTTQLVRRLYAYFGDDLGVYHSRFSNNERVEIWEKAADGRYKVVAGPRSAIWLPFQKLGVIICDEEHDSSYKQRDPAPRFHARDAAIYLAGLHGAPAILGSATPSVESLYNVQQGKYAYAGLKERYLGVQMPRIEIINARERAEGAAGKRSPGILTPSLQEAMKEALAKKRQIILFQNRRGYAPFQICTVCGWVPECRNCAVSLTYHKRDDKMQCHYCGLAVPVPQTCAQCGSNRLVSRSFGTEKIEEEVKSLFPEARVARMDLDTMRGRHALSELLDSMEAQQTDILVGTQMVVKGLDFAPVALVAILSADALLSYPDFRVNERGFQLMEQVAGRAGRADGKGRVLIQAYNLDHPALQWVCDHDVGAFYRHEIGYREFFQYPPFSRMIRLVFRHREEEKTAQAATHMAETLQQFAGISVAGPVAALVPRVRNQFVQEMLLKCPRDLALLQSLKAFLKEQRKELQAHGPLRDVQVVIDVDPA
jgi:primosomal protein N' (replication factor Y)